MRRAAFALLLAGCTSGASSPHDLAARAAPAPLSPSVAAPVKLPDRAEVEMSGLVELPKGKTGETEIWVTDGPCWQKTTSALSRAGSTATGWGVEVFVPQGTQLWVCGRLAPKPGQKATIHGEAGPFVGKGAGEVVFGQVPLRMSSGAPVEAPPTKK